MLRRVLLIVLFGPLVATAATAQAVATVCKDGSSSATSGRGACSGHGGVDKEAIKHAAKAAKAEQEAATKAAKQSGTTVSCGDGSSSRPGRGACSHHGGVKVASSPVSAPLPAAAARPQPTASAPAVRAPATHRGEDADPTGAIAQCKDGMYSHAANRRGACSRHKGVAKWMAS